MGASDRVGVVEGVLLLVVVGTMLGLFVVDVNATAIPVGLCVCDCNGIALVGSLVGDGSSSFVVPAVVNDDEEEESSGRFPTTTTVVTMIAIKRSITMTNAIIRRLVALAVAVVGVLVGVTCSFGCCCSSLPLSFVAPPLGVAIQVASMDGFGWISLTSPSLLLSSGIVVDIIAIIPSESFNSWLDVFVREGCCCWEDIFTSTPMTDSINERTCCTMTTFIIMPCSLQRYKVK